MANKTIDDLYILLERNFDKLNTIKENNIRQNTDFEDIVNNLNRLNNNLNDYNTTFEKEILKSQQDNLKEIERYNKELADLHKQHEDSLEKWREREKTAYDRIQKTIDDAQRVLADKTKSVAEKQQARKDIEQAEKDRKEKDKEFDDTREGKSLNRKINYREDKIKEKKDNITSAEEDRQAYKKSKIGKNTSKFADNVKNMQQNGKMMQSLGKSVGGKFGGAISKAGSGLTKFAGALGKAVPVIGWVITALQLLGDAAKAVAEADAELQEIQNERNTARTNRNIERSKLNTQSLIDELETATANGLATFGVESNYAIGQQNIDNMKAIAGAQVATGAITNGYNAAAWDAYNAQLDINAAQAKLGIEYATESAKTERANALRDLERSGREQVRQVDAKLIDQDLREKETELDKRDRDYTREHAFSTTFNRMVGSSTNADNVYNPGGNAYGTVESANKTSIETAATMGAIESIPLLGSLISPFTDAAYTKQDTLAKQMLVNERNLLNSTKAQTENTTSMANTIKSSSNQFKDAFADSSKQIADALIDTQTTIKKTYSKFSQDIEQWTLKFEKSSLDSATSKGLTTLAQNSQYSRFMNEATQLLAHNWGLKADEVIQMQNAYGQGTGRSLIGGATDLNKTAALGKYLGDNGLAVEIANSTEIFNMGMSTTMDTMWEMTKSVNKMGLDGRKYMKDMTKNLKMAQKYNFKDGVQGMMRMAKWAQNVRFDMDKLPGLLEDILGGGLEGIIEKGAKLQVLGGNFAMGADPLAMMFEAMNDPEALAQRINDMTRGMGSFDSKTGQVKFNGLEQQQLRLLAEYTGQSLEDVKNQASYKIKNEKMGNIISSDLNDEQRASLVNKSYYDSETGKWMVNDINGNPIDVSSVNKDNIKSIQADTHEGRMEQMLQEIVGWQDKSVGLSEEQQAKISQALVDAGDYFKNQEARYQEQLKENEKIEEWRGRVAQIWTDVTSSFEAFKSDIITPEQAAQKALEHISSVMDTIQTNVSSIAAKLQAEIDNSKNGSGQADATAELMWEWFEDESNAGNIKEVKDKLRKLKQERENGLSDSEYLKRGREIAAIGYDDLLDGAEASGFLADDDASLLTINKLDQMIGAMKDGVASSNGSSMLTAASNVTPIHDGSIQLAKSDPQDTALFAKAGGPFDTLFNGIFAKINDIHNILPKAMDYTMPLENLSNNLRDNNSKYTTNNSNIKIDTVKVEISGKLELSGSNGTSVDIVNELKNNPLLLKQLSEMLSENISKSINGGRTVMEGLIPTTRFKGM